MDGSRLNSLECRTNLRGDRSHVEVEFREQAVYTLVAGEPVVRDAGTLVPVEKLLPKRG